MKPTEFREMAGKQSDYLATIIPIEYDNKIAQLEKYGIKQKLLERFDIKNAKKIFWYRASDKQRYKWEINIPCVLCEKYALGLECDECPLAVFSTDHLDGCLVILRKKYKILKSALHFKYNKIWWTDENHDIAIEELQHIYEIIKTL